MKRQLFFYFFILGSLAAAPQLGCTTDQTALSDTIQSVPADARLSIDATSAVDAGLDDLATIPVDGSAVDIPAVVEDAAVDTATASFSQCSGACATPSLKAVFGGANEPFERAVYGLEKDAQGNWRIYIEALNGGFSGCPQQNSPTPDRTLIIAGLPLPVAPTTVSAAGGVTVSLLDFQGTLVATPFAKALSASVTYVAADVCTTCYGQTPPSHAAGFVALDLSATFADGVVSGHLYAEHCDSLDD